MTSHQNRPLSGLKVVHLGGIGPSPFAGMVLADLGAEVIWVQRPSERGDAPNPVLDRGKRSVIVDMKDARGVAVVRRLLAEADACIEGFRPGVAERLGVGPAEATLANPKIVYGRMTGYGQSGPLAHMPGHDINYIAASGVLHGLGRAGEPPAFPANLVGDFGGGGMFLAFGIVSGVLAARATGRGSVVDAAMIDGASVLWAMMWGFEAMGEWSADRGVNELDSGAPYYNVYSTADGEFVAVASLEAQFFEALVRTLDLELPEPLGQFDYRNRDNWPYLAKVLGETFGALTLGQVEELFDGVEACVTPILSRSQAVASTHSQARGSFIDSTEGVHPAPAPRFGAVDRVTGEVDYSKPQLPPSAPLPGADTHDVLEAAGFTASEIDDLVAAGVVVGHRDAAA